MCFEGFAMLRRPPCILRRFRQFLQCIFHSTHTSAIADAYAVAILTEWEEFKQYDWSGLIKTMKSPANILDGRNILPMIDNPSIHQYAIGNG